MMRTNTLRDGPQNAAPSHALLCAKRLPHPATPCPLFQMIQMANVPQMAPISSKVSRVKCFLFRFWRADSNVLTPDSIYR